MSFHHVLKRLRGVIESQSIRVTVDIDDVRELLRDYDRIDASYRAIHPESQSRGALLGEIIEAAKSGERPIYDDLRLAVCAMDALMTFDRLAIWKLADGEQEGRKPFLVYSALWQREEQFGRIKRAMATAPLQYLGPNHDPDAPEVQARRQQSIRLYEKVAARKSGEK
ncbi:hypothetical protein [Aquipseudomonas campi]